MSVKMSDSGGVLRVADALADIMEQHRQTELRAGRNRFERAHRVLPQRIAVVWIVLLKADHRTEFGEDFCDDRRILHQNPAGIRRADDLNQFRSDAFGGDLMQKSAAVENRRAGLRFDLQSVCRGKAQGAQNAQGILGQPFGRIANTAEHAAGQISLTAERIAQSVPGTPRHGVDGKIAPREIRTDVGDK